MFASLLLGLMACDFKAATAVRDTASASNSTDSSPADDTGGDDIPADDTADDGTPDPREIDNDRDGYSEATGDCDDDDDTVAPGLEDTCDGADTDCDETIDEDAEPDVYEPNDVVDFNFGALEDTLEATGFLTNEDDIDRFRFTYTDSWIDFDGLTVALNGLDGSVTYKMEVINVDTDEEIFEDFNRVDDESILFELDSSWGSDSGEFRVVISSLGGGNCLNTYQLEIVHSDWWKK